MNYKVGLLVSVVLMAGCSTSPQHAKGPALSEIYDKTHRQGSRDAIQVLREGMRSNHMYGATDPYIPMRKPDEIIPVWVPAQRDKRTGRLIQGHWEHSVIRWSDWQTR